MFRAVENRVAMVKSDGTGNDSAIIDPYGRIVKRAVTSGGSRGLLVADVVLGTGAGAGAAGAPPPAVMLGDWVGWLCLAGMVFFVLVEPMARRRGRPR